MENNNLKHMLDVVFEDDIEEDAKESFIYFLMACGAYDEFIKHFEIKKFIAFKERTCDNNAYMAFYQIISYSFLWCGTYHGYAFWDMMHTMHHMILYAKYKKKIIKPNDIVIRRMEYDNDSIFDQIDYLKSRLNLLKTKNKKIYMFISKLKDYFKEIRLE